MNTEFRRAGFRSTCFFSIFLIYIVRCLPVSLSINKVEHVGRKRGMSIKDCIRDDIIYIGGGNVKQYGCLRGIERFLSLIM